MKPHRPISECVVAAILFAMVSVINGFLIDKRDIYNNALIHSMLDASVTQGTFELGLSQHPLLDPKVDVFEYEGKTYSNKQPGLYFWGAPVYSILRMLDFGFEDDYFAASSLLAFFGATCWIAFLAVVIQYFVTRVLGMRILVGVGIALLFSFATVLFPYSQIYYHDTIATAFVCLGYICLKVASHRVPDDGARNVKWMFSGGVFLGGSILMSMLPLAIVAVLSVYFIRLKDWVSSVCYGMGVSLGFVVILIYNFFVFGSWIKVGYVELGDQLVKPIFSMTHVMGQFWGYWSDFRFSVTHHFPVMALGMVAVLRKGAFLKRERVLLLSIYSFHFVYICILPTYGLVQYPPRFLLPLCLFSILPWIGIFNEWRTLKWGRLLRPVCIVVIVVSVFSGWMGSLYGTTNFGHEIWLPFHLLMTHPAPALWHFALLESGMMIGVVLVSAMGGALAVFLVGRLFEHRALRER